MKKCTSTVREGNFEKARKIIREQKRLKKQVMFISSDDNLTRKILEKEPVDILVILQSHRKDRQKQRDSGFNQVLAKIAKKNKVKIGICLDEILASKSKQRAEILARVMQNIRLCSKNKIPMKFCGENTRDIYDLKSLGLVLGMPTWMTKNL
jgi:ribonuclease P/MRP protein subunit RPP1